MQADDFIDSHKVAPIFFCINEPLFARTSYMAIYTTNGIKSTKLHSIENIHNQNEDNFY